jgi:superfamily II RNA helicase
MLKSLAKALDSSGCPGPEEAVIRRRRRRQLKSLRRRLIRERNAISGHWEVWAALTRGRVFMDMLGSLGAVLRRESEGEQAGVLAVNLTPERRLQKGRPRLDFVPLNEVSWIYQEILNLPHAGGGRALAQAVLDKIPANPRPLTASDLTGLGKRELSEADDRLLVVDEELAGLVCLECSLATACLNNGEKLSKMLNQVESMLVQTQEKSYAFWYDFVRHLEFLRAEGYVDAQGRLTTDGAWASNLRLDQPVLIAEAIRQEALPMQDPVLLAALVALFVDNREREAETRYSSQRLKDGVVGLRRTLGPILERLRQWGFETPVMPQPVASAVFAWGLGAAFTDVAAIYGAGEGDLANLIYRTADNLRQIISLHDTHPVLVSCAREAVDLLLRPPVVVPV